MAFIIGYASLTSFAVFKKMSLSVIKQRKTVRKIIDGLAFLLFKEIQWSLKSDDMKKLLYFFEIKTLKIL